MLSVIYAYCRNYAHHAECHNDECRHGECRGVFFKLEIKINQRSFQT